MHYAWKIARQGMKAADVPAMAGVDIKWVHENEEDSCNAANEMVTAYGIVFAPSLTSRHTEGRAIDMTITQYAGKTFNRPLGQTPFLVNTPTQLHTLGAIYGVRKLVSDPPHWSDDGH
jgi:hypothetical protein